MLLCFMTFTYCLVVFFLQRSILLLSGCSYPGYYGENCSLECPQNCQDGYCDIVEGTCFGCSNRYIGPRCTKGRCPFSHEINNACSLWMSIYTMHLVILSFAFSSRIVFLMCTRSWMNRHLLKDLDFVLDASPTAGQP